MQIKSFPNIVQKQIAQRLMKTGIWRAWTPCFAQVVIHFMQQKPSTKIAHNNNKSAVTNIITKMYNTG